MKAMRHRPTPAMPFINKCYILFWVYACLCGIFAYLEGCFGPVYIAICFIEGICACHWRLFHPEIKLNALKNLCHVCHNLGMSFKEIVLFIKYGYLDKKYEKHAAELKQKRNNIIESWLFHLKMLLSYIILIVVNLAVLCYFGRFIQVRRISLNNITKAQKSTEYFLVCATFLVTRFVCCALATWPVLSCFVGCYDAYVKPYLRSFGENE